MAYQPASILVQPHVIFDKEEEAWEVGYGKPTFFIQVVMSAHMPTYEIFDEDPPRSLTPNLNPPPAIATYMLTYTNSDIDIISLDTLECLGYDVESIIQVAPAARHMLRDLDINIRGGVFVTIRVTNPATMRSSHTRSLVYMADCMRNHMCKHTMEALTLRGDRSLGELTPLNIPTNP